MINPRFFLTLEPRHRTEVVGGFYLELGRGGGSVGGKAGCGASVVPALPLLTNQSTSIFSPISMDKIGTIRDAEARKLDAYLVDSSGNIDIPYIGKIKAYGLICTSLSDSIKNKLLEFVKTPSVSTKILNFRVSILGQVASPGTFNVIDQSMSFTELISRAGDFSKNADPTNVMIIRNINNKITTAYIDLTSFEFFNSEYYFLKERNNDEMQHFWRNCSIFSGVL